MHKIFIIEDDKIIADSISECLRRWDLECIVAKNFQNIMKEFADEQPSLVIVDIGLPFMNGYHWCSEIRKVSSVPVVFVSSASDNMNIVMAMNMGADDFICKPFDINVLIAKIHALLRRTYSYGQPSNIFESDGAILNISDYTLSYEDSIISLTKNECRLLLCLLQNKGVVVSRETLMEELWKTDSFVDENTLTVNVGRLRKKLEEAGLKDFIKTKFGVGYIVGGNDESIA